VKYLFGQEKTISFEARSLEHAIKIFKATELFPEQYVDKKFRERNVEGNYDYKYDDDLSREIYKFKPGALIYIYDNQWKKLGSVSLEECINVDYQTLIPSVPLLEAPRMDSDQENKEILPVIGSDKAVAQMGTKLALREAHDTLMRKRAELERLTSEIRHSLEVIHKELKQKQKVLYILELFMGIREEVIEIKEGVTAPDDTSLTLFQQVLYMDEEVGIWDNGEGIDFRDIGMFDEWIAKEYKRFLYQPKSICVFKVRRKEKDYGDPIINFHFNTENKKSYFVIRNGEQVCRIWSDVTIGDRLFPTKKEYQNLYEEWKNWSEDQIKEKLQDHHESYLYGLLAIQGLLERTEVLGSEFRKHINLMRPDGIPEEWVNFVRDDEPEFWLTDGRPAWKDYIKANAETIGIGSRVVLSTREYYFSLTKDDVWRSYPFRPGSPPSRNQIYIIDALADKGLYHGETYIIHYFPQDWRKRKRRVCFRLYPSEILNFDKITLEDAEYYESNRLYRKDYLSILPTLHWIKLIRKEEQSLEFEFTKFIAGKLGWDESGYPEIRKEINHWKLKNKWKRDLTMDEAKAVRMILKKLSLKKEV
jgi:hypothetical protein